MFHLPRPPVRRRSPLRVLRSLVLAAGLPAAAQAAVDANTATPEQLDALSGIGPRIAQRIVDERRARPFRDLHDLQERVRGIGPATLGKLTAAGLAVGAAAGRGSVGRAGAPHPAVIEVAPAGPPAGPAPVPSRAVAPRTR